MIFGYLLLFVALTISTVAAFYSIAGLTAIFAAAFWPIVIMGSVLELGKIITTVWLHKYWDRVAVQFKLYLVPAIAILMLITSMGIFGFLSKAHLDQAVPAGDISSQVQIFDDKIKTERDNIEAARRALKQMDAQVDEKLSRTTDDRGAERAVQIRRNQSKERTTLQNEISSAQKKITVLQEQRAPVASQARKVEAEVGPIKYIAALIYGDNPDANLLEKAVRWVIILIVLVFDPLALVLILAADQTFEWHRGDRKRRQGWSQVWQPDTENPWADWNNKPKATEDFDPRPKYEPDNGPLLDEQIDKIQELADQQIAEEQTKNTTLIRELEAVKATAENLKKKFVNWTNKFKRKN
jgi:cytochrome c oxidase subunit IV